MAKYWNLRGQVVVLNSNATPLSTLLPTKLVAEAQGRVDWFRSFFVWGPRGCKRAQTIASKDWPATFGRSSLEIWIVEQAKNLAGTEQQKRTSDHCLQQIAVFQQVC
jgi:uncharacterized heparinase superfamily protein